MAFDVCHDQIVRALQKAGWRLENAPHRLHLEFRTVYVDARLSRGSNGRHEQVMLVEVKCFPDEDSTTKELYASIGQCLVYRAMIGRLDLPYSLYLAVPDSIFDKVFDSIVMQIIEETQIRVVVVNLESESVVQWIE